MRVSLYGNYKPERHSFLEKLIRVFSVPLLNYLPKSVVQKIMRSTSRDAATVVGHGGSMKALDVMYTRHNRRLFSRGFTQGIADTFWHHLVSQPRALRNRLMTVESLLEREMMERSGSREKKINILNIGSGSSRAIVQSINKLTKNGVQINIFVTNIDKDAGAIEMGKEMVKNFKLESKFKWINDDARSIRNLIERESVDIVEMVGLLDYFNEEKGILVFKNIYDTLKKGGVFITANVHPNREMRFVNNTGWPEMYYRSTKDVEKMLRIAGFTDIDVRLEPLKIHVIGLSRK